MKRKYFLKSLVLFGSLSLSFFVSSCGENTSVSNNPSSNTNTSVVTKIPVVSLTINAEKLNLKVGETINISATILPSNASNKEVKYTSSLESVLTVNNEGAVCAKSIGSADIIGTSVDGNKTSRLSFNVSDPNTNANLNIEDYSSLLSSTPFSNTDISGSENFGLNDETNVGVIEKSIKEKYIVPNLDSFSSSRVIDASKITLEQIKKYYSSATEVNDFYIVQTAFNEAKKISNINDKILINLPSRVMNIDSTLGNKGKVFVLDGLVNTYIKGNDTTILLDTKSGDWNGYFEIKNCNNVLINGVTFDLLLPSNLTGQITSINEEEKTITASIDKQFNNLVSHLIEKNKLTLRSWVEFDFKSKAPLQGGNFVVDGVSNYDISGNETDGYVFKVKFNNAIKRSRNNTYVSMQFSQYDASGISISNCEDVYLENLTMFHASGMALVASSTTNLYINRFNLMLKEGTKDLVTATADGMHFDRIHGDCLITNCLLENSHDDALNIKHGYYYKLTAAEGGSSKSMSLAKITSEVDTPKIGDKIEVYTENTFVSHNPTAGYYTIASVNKTSVGYDITVNERMSNVSEWGTCRVTFGSNTPKFSFTNNIIRNKRNRGILVQVPNALIENNSFINVGHGSIQAASAMDVYNEATLPQGIVIRSNKFINNCYLLPEPLYGDVSIFAIANNGSVAPANIIHDAKIENNFFTKNGNSAISLRGVGSSLINANLFSECSRVQPSGETFKTILHCYNVDKIDVNSNYNYNTFESNVSGIILQGLATESNLTLKDNTNIKFQVINEVGPEVDILKANKTIIIDGVLDDAIAASASNVNIVGYSEAEGSEVDPTKYSSHFNINKLLLTHNDKGIYIGVDIHDDELNVKTINDFWLGDCIEIFISTITNMPNADMQVYKESGGVIQAAFAPTWKSSNYCALASVRTNSSIISNKNMIESSFVTSANGYVGEILIPFEISPFIKDSITNNKRIDIALVVADAERTTLGTKRLQYGNVPHFVENNKTKTLLMPQYLFKAK